MMPERSAMKSPFERFSFIACFLGLQVSLAGAQGPFEETFDIYPPDADAWNFCQVAAKLNSRWESDRAHGAAYRFGIDSDRGEPRCRCVSRQCVAFSPAALFAMPLFEGTGEETPLLPGRPEEALGPLRNPCADYDTARIPPRPAWKRQKNELRQWGEDWRKGDEGTWFSLRFRIDGDIEPCGSMRWVGGQFKAYRKDDSPFLAQRFDNGVFHVTIEAPDPTDATEPKKIERIIVAKAPGNPDLGSRFQPPKENEAPKRYDSKTCDMSTGASKREDCVFFGRVEPLGGALPPSDSGEWIDMDYYVRMRGPCDPARPAACDRLVEIWANGEPVARVTGHFGAREAHKVGINFKIGVYRDLQRGNAGLVVDHVTVRADPTKAWSPRQR
jgi:hypothetical protein